MSDPMNTDDSASGMARPASDSSRPTNSRVVVGLIALVILALTWFAYRPGLRSPFLFDDTAGLLRNSSVRSVRSVLADAQSHRFGQLPFALNYALDGYETYGYHLVNTAIHAAAGLALFGFLRRTLSLPGVDRRLARQATSLAAAIALLWVVHPLQTQAVTYVIQRYESLMGLCLFVGLYAFVRGATAPSASPWSARGWFALVVVAAFLGVESKEPLVVFPLLLLLFDRAFLAATWRESWERRKWVHLGVSAASVYLVVNMRWALDSSRSSTAGFGVAGVTPWEYLRSQAGVIVHYLRLALWPDVLCFDYRWPVASVSAAVLPGLFLLALLGLSAYGYRRHPRLAFVGLAFFLLLALSSSFVPIDDLAVEHRMYAPLACVLTLAVLAADRVLERLAARFVHDPRSLRVLAAGLLTAVVVALSLRTIERNRDYADPIRLWSKVIAVNPNNDRAYGYLAGAYLDRGQLDRAEALFHEALKVNPRDYRAYSSLGSLYSRQKKYDAAIQHYRAALKLRPRYEIAAANLANVYALQKSYGPAIELYRQALRINPKFSDAWKNLGVACAEHGDEAAAIKALRRDVELDPRDLAAPARLARLLAAADDPALRSPEEALEIARRLVERTEGRDVGALEALAAAQAARDDYADAARTIERALGLTDDETTRERLSRQRGKYRARLGSTTAARD